jgi:predicted PurR-regulated permease PerM
MATGQSLPARPAHEQPPRRQPGRRTVRLIAVITVILVALALRMSQPVTLPLALAIFVVVLAWPLQARLERALPRKVAYVLTVLAVLLVLALFCGALWWSGHTVAEKMPEYQPRFAELRAQVERWASQRGIPLPWSGGGGGQAMEQGLSIAKQVATAAYSALGLVVLVLALALLGLLEVRDFRTKVRRRLDGGPAMKLLDIAGEIAAAFRRYFVVKTLTSAITGVATGLLALAVGLDFPFVWGLAAFLLEYVPTLGSIAAVVPPSVFAFLQFQGTTRPLLIFAGFAVLQVTLGNIVDPRIEGRYMSLSPAIVLLSIVLWAWIWGPVGALLGVPLTVAVVVTCEHFASTRWIAALATDLRDDEGGDA